MRYQCRSSQFMLIDHCITGNTMRVFQFCSEAARAFAMNCVKAEYQAISYFRLVVKVMRL